MINVVRVAWGWLRKRLGWGAYLVVPLVLVAVVLWLLWRGAKGAAAKLKKQNEDLVVERDNAADSARRVEKLREQEREIERERDTAVEKIERERTESERRTEAEVEKVRDAGDDVDELVRQMREARERGEIP